VLEGGHPGLAKVDHSKVAGLRRASSTRRRCAKTLVRRAPVLPRGRSAELRRSLSEDLLECATEGLVTVVAAGEGDRENGVVLVERQAERCPPKPEQSHVFVHADAEGRRELPVKVILRDAGHCAEALEGKTAVEMLVDVLEDPAEAVGVGLHRHRRSVRSRKAQTSVPSLSWKPARSKSGGSCQPADGGSVLRNER